AEALPLPSAPLERGLRALVRGELAARAGRFDEAAEAFDTAEQTFQVSEDAGGHFCVALGRADLHVQQGNSCCALENLKRLESHPILSSVPWLGAVLVAERLCLTAETASDVKELRVEYEELRRRFPSDLRDLRVSQALGRWHARRQDWAQAQADYRWAL